MQSAAEKNVKNLPGAKIPFVNHLFPSYKQEISLSRSPEQTPSVMFNPLSVSPVSPYPLSLRPVVLFSIVSVCPNSRSLRKYPDSKKLHAVC